MRALISLLMAYSAFGAEYYAATNGSSAAAGTYAAPWTLQCVAANTCATSLAAGDTVWLLSGDYRGSGNVSQAGTWFDFQKGGTAGNPITIRAYPGARVRIMPPTTSGCGRTIVNVKDGEGYIVFRDLEVLNDFPSCRSFPTTGDTSNPSLNVLGCTSQSAGDTITCTGHPYVSGDSVDFYSSTARPAPISAYQQYFLCNITANTFQLSSSSTCSPIIDLTQDLTGIEVRMRRFDGGFTIGSNRANPGVQIINCINHDTSELDFFSGDSGASGAMIYGTASFNNGWEGQDRGHGHGIYTQNAPWVTATVDDTADTVVSASHGLAAGTTVYVSATTTLPAGLSRGTKYYVCNPASGTFQLSTSSGCSPLVTDYSGLSGTFRYLNLSLTPKKHIQNVAFRNFGGYGLHGYTGSQQSSQQYFESNVVIGNDSTVQADLDTASHLTLTGNHFYADAATSWGTGIFTTASSTNTPWASFTGNYFWGEVSIGKPESIVFTGNVIGRTYGSADNYGTVNIKTPGTSPTYNMSSVFTAVENFASNTYYRSNTTSTATTYLSPSVNLCGGGGCVWLPMNNAAAGELVTALSDWTGGGYESGSALKANDACPMPTGCNPASSNTVNYVAVYPNAYEPGRGLIVVENWTQAATASVDLSTVLRVGDPYEIRDTQCLLSCVAIATGAYTGGSVTITLPTSASTTESILGNYSARGYWTWPVAHTGVSFNALQVRRLQTYRTTTISAKAPASTASAQLQYGYRAASGTITYDAPTQTVACSTTCTLSISQAVGDAYFRITFLDAGSSTLGQYSGMKAAAL